MQQRAELQAALTQVLAQRVSTEQLVTALRQNLAAWRKEEAGRGAIGRALLWSYGELWTGRIESFAASLDAHLTALRNREAELGQAMAQAPADAAPPRARPAKPKRAARRR